MREMNRWGGLAIALLWASVLMGCGPRLHFRHVSVLSSEVDEATKSRRVRVTFEVWQGEQQLTNLSRDAFNVSEDGQPATSESLNEAATQELRVPVALVLDTSLSMYQANAISALKSAAQRFIDSIHGQGFEVTVYRFASTVESGNDVSFVPDTFDQAGGERWTSLYAAVQEAMDAHPNGVVVVFSDGADNYSQNHGVADAEAILTRVRPKPHGTGEARVVHAIGFGNVKTERDRQGLAAREFLEHLGENGSFHLAEASGAFEAIFADIASRIRNVYVYEYFSPNLSGEHSIVVEVRANGQRAKTEPLLFGAETDSAADLTLKASLTSLGWLTFSGHPSIALYATMLLDQCMNIVGGTPDEVACDALVAHLEEVGDARALETTRRWLVAGLCADWQFDLCDPEGPSNGGGTDRRVNTSPVSPEPTSEDVDMGVKIRVQEDGAVILEVAPDKGAALAGLVPGDIIVAVDGRSSVGATSAQLAGDLSGPKGCRAVVTVKRLSTGERSDVKVSR